MSRSKQSLTEEVRMLTRQLDEARESAEYWQSEWVREASTVEDFVEDFVPFLGHYVEATLISNPGVHQVPGESLVHRGTVVEIRGEEDIQIFFGDGSCIHVSPRVQWRWTVRTQAHQQLREEMGEPVEEAPVEPQRCQDVLLGMQCLDRYGHVGAHMGTSPDGVRTMWTPLDEAMPPIG